MFPQKQWYYSSTADQEQVKQLCREWNTNQYVAEILLRRGYKTREEIRQQHNTYESPTQNVQDVITF